MVPGGGDYLEFLKSIKSIETTPGVKMDEGQDSVRRFQWPLGCEKPGASNVLFGSPAASHSGPVAKSPLTASFHFLSQVPVRFFLSFLSGMLIPRSSVRFPQKLKKLRTQIYMDLLHRPSSNGTKLLLQAIKAINAQHSGLRESCIRWTT